MFMWAMSDRGILRSYRIMQAFEVNTYTLINKDGQRLFVKFLFTPTLGVHSPVWDEALKTCGQVPDFHRKDLYTAMDMGVYPTSKFGIQVCPEFRQDDFDFGILDATKVWPEELLLVRYIGEMQLIKKYVAGDQIFPILTYPKSLLPSFLGLTITDPLFPSVDEHFTQIEQVAFCTAHLVPRISFSDDPRLQGCNFSYFDSQLSRLGVNWQELPVNRTVCPVMNNHRDGQLHYRITKGKINYWPNRQSSKPEQGSYVDYREKAIAIKQRLHSVKFSEHFS